jgi:hypothetical protein
LLYGCGRWCVAHYIGFLAQKRERPFSEALKKEKGLSWSRDGAGDVALAT